MSHLPKVIHALRQLLGYPDQHTLQTCELLFVVLQGELPEAASQVSQFGAAAEQRELWELEEIYTRTFDVNPTCALEVGWHLFGEEYARGMFLVRMREELRKYNLPESTELPDHVCHVLDIVNAMPAEEATRFVKACVQPAIEQMNAAVVDKDTPYRHVIGCLTAVLRHAFGEPSVDDDGQAFDLSRPIADPLHAFPMADEGDCQAGGCGVGQSTCGEPILVPLQLHPASGAMQDDTLSDREES